MKEGAKFTPNTDIKNLISFEYILKKIKTPRNEVFRKYCFENNLDIM
jgi:hypothetical protein